MARWPAGRTLLPQFLENSLSWQHRGLFYFTRGQRPRVGQSRLGDCEHTWGESYLVSTYSREAVSTGGSCRENGEAGQAECLIGSPQASRSQNVVDSDLTSGVHDGVVIRLLCDLLRCHLSIPGFITIVLSQHHQTLPRQLGPGGVYCGFPIAGAVDVSKLLGWKLLEVSTW